MTHQRDDQTEDRTPVHSHDCGNLFGCGDEKGTGVIREDIKDAAFDKRAADRLAHMDEMDQERVDGFLTARCLCAVQHRGELSGDASRRYRARGPRDDPEEPV